jgi:hypothetical protein
MTSKIRFRGATSGFVELAAPDAAGSNTLTLPTGNGTAGQYLQTAGSSGELSWQTVSTPNVAFESYAVIADQKTSNTDAGTFSSGDWRTRDLNTELFDPDGIVSISSNQFTLGAGTYYMVAYAPAHRVDKHIARVRNVTDSVDVAFGTSEVANNGTYNTSTSKVFARVTITSSKAFEVQHKCETTFTDRGFGWGVGFSVEKYTVVEIFKEA